MGGPHAYHTPGGGGGGGGGGKSGKGCGPIRTHQSHGHYISQGLQYRLPLVVLTFINPGLWLNKNRVKCVDDSL